MSSERQSRPPMTFAEWCRLRRFSPRTGHRLRSEGLGPPEFRLYGNRCGSPILFDRDDEEQWWLSHRTPPATPQPPAPRNPGRPRTRS